MVAQHSHGKITSTYIIFVRNLDKITKNNKEVKTNKEKLSNEKKLTELK